MKPDFYTSIAAPGLWPSRPVVCRTGLSLLFSGILLFSVDHVRGQALCANPNTLFGLDANGLLYSVSSTTGSVSTNINTASYTSAGSYTTVVAGQTTSPIIANALGYNATNGNFYYFKIDPANATRQFITYNPSTNLYTTLATPPMTVSVHAGCVNFNGTGYYCLDVSGDLYYYDIAADTWTLITSTFTDQFANNVTATFQAMSTGDMAIDGLNNLWFMASNSGNYGLYQLSAPLPTAPVASIVLQNIFPTTTVTPDGTSLYGVAFDAQGHIFLSTSGNNLYELTSSTSSTPTFINGLSKSLSDLSSCAFPLSVLPLTLTAFTADLQQGGSVLLNWSVGQESDYQGFTVERSTDGSNWQAIGRATYSPTHADEYSFSDMKPAPSYNYYRLRIVTSEGASTYSGIREITLENTSTGQISVWPNPVSEAVNIQISNANGAAGSSYALVYDFSGRVLIQATLQPGLNKILLKDLPASNYLIRVRLPNGEWVNKEVLKLNP